MLRERCFGLNVMKTRLSLVVSFLVTGSTSSIQHDCSFYRHFESLNDHSFLKIDE